MDKKVFLVLVAVVLLSSPVFAYDLNGVDDDNTFAVIGNTIMRGSFAGSGVFFALIMIILFGIFMWQTNMPDGAVVGIGMILFFALSPFLGGWYTLLLNLTLLAIGVMIGLAIRHFIR